MMAIPDWLRRRRAAEEFDPEQRARAALRPLGLPKKLVRTVLAALPQHATEPTLDLLTSAIRQWASDTRGTAEAVPAALAGAWQRDGGSVADLERLAAMFRYRRVRQSAGPYAAGQQPEVRKAEDELRSFWVTTGHDVVDLDRYMADVDAEFPDIIPG